MKHFLSATIVLFIIFILFGLFGWYVIRPIIPKKTCARQAEYYAKIQHSSYEDEYEFCLHNYVSPI